MTISELIEKLKEYPLESEVVLHADWTAQVKSVYLDYNSSGSNAPVPTVHLDERDA